MYVTLYIRPHFLVLTFFSTCLYISSDNILIDRYNVIKISHGGYHSIFTNLDREIRTGELVFKRYAQGYYSKAALHGKVQFENDIFSYGAVSYN